MADAANSAGDLLIDAVVFYTIKESRKKATPEMPWGRGKIEPLGALTIGGVLLATGAGTYVSTSLYIPVLTSVHVYTHRMNIS
jgi:divalent metal cation (Fe/Co/Zn/Cd) transporter